MKEVYDRLKSKNFSNNKFEKWVNNSNTKKIFSEEDIKEIKALWYKKSTMPKEVKEKTYKAENLKDLNKDQLDEYAINSYGIDLDKRFSKANMIEELNEELSKQKDQ